MQVHTYNTLLAFKTYDAMKILYALSLAIITLCSCNSNRKTNQENGLNVSAKDNDKILEYYTYNSKYNGIYCEYSSKSVFCLGTYQMGERDGIWDTAVSSPYADPLIYSNGKIVGQLDKKIRLKVTKAPKFDFVFLNPLGWQVKDSLKSKYVLSSVSPLSFDNIHPWLVICKVETKENSLKKIFDDYYQSDLGTDSNVIDYLRESEVTNSYIEKRKTDTLYYLEKIIKNKNGIYKIGCGCPIQSAKHYRPLFKTIINSFTPMSSTLQ